MSGWQDRLQHLAGCTKAQKNYIEGKLLQFEDERAARYFKDNDAPEDTVQRLTPLLPETVGARDCSLDELLSEPLPDARVSGASSSVRHKDRKRHTHPTTVDHWGDCVPQAKERLSRRDVEAWRATRYRRLGFEAASHQLSEDGAVSYFEHTAGARLNELFEKVGKNLCIALHPNKCKTDSQEEAQRSGHGLVEEQPEETEHKDWPDLCCLPVSGRWLPVLTTVEFKTRFRLRKVHLYKMKDVWEAAKNGIRLVGLEPEAAENALRVLAQELGYMARRGHKYGGVSTSEYLWLLKADGVGGLRVSDPIPHDARGDFQTLSATEAFLFIILANYDNKNQDAYPTATKPGEQPVSPVAMMETRSMAQMRLAQEAAPSAPAAGSEAAGGSPCSTSGATSRAVHTLQLTRRLGSPSCNVFLGSLAGEVAAVRLATTPQQRERALKEVEAYERLSALQGSDLPRLLAHGPTADGAGYYVATQFVQGENWNWDMPAHRELDGKVQEVVARIHNAGVLHGDTHSGNMLVTPEGRVVMLDFEQAVVGAPAAELRQEGRQMDTWLSLQVAGKGVATAG